jgi:hypothetical protein
MLQDMAGNQKIQTVRAYGQLRCFRQQIGGNNAAFQVRVVPLQVVAIQSIDVPDSYLSRQMETPPQRSDFNPSAVKIPPQIAILHPA